MEKELLAVLRFFLEIGILSSVKNNDSSAMTF